MVLNLTAGTGVPTSNCYWRPSAVREVHSQQLGMTSPTTLTWFKTQSNHDWTSSGICVLQLGWYRTRISKYWYLWHRGDRSQLVTSQYSQWGPWTVPPRGKNAIPLLPIAPRCCVESLCCDCQRLGSVQSKSRGDDHLQRWMCVVQADRELDSAQSCNWCVREGEQATVTDVERYQKQCVRSNGYYAGTLEGNKASSCSRVSWQGLVYQRIVLRIADNQESAVQVQDYLYMQGLITQKVAEDILTNTKAWSQSGGEFFGTLVSSSH